MFPFIKTVFLTLALALGAVPPAAAATLTLTTSFDLTKQAGDPDTPGLSGASVVLTAVFADGTRFTRGGFDVPRAVASSLSFAIGGASVAATNGTYAATRMLGLFATGNPFDGYLTTGPDTFFLSPNADATFFGVAGLVNQVRLSAGGSVGTAAVGELLTLERLKGVTIGTGGVQLFSKSGVGGSSYTMSNFVNTATTDAAPVPLPAGLPLLAVSLGLLAVLRRKPATLA